MKENMCDTRVLLLASGDLWAGAEAVVYQLICGLKNFDGLDVLGVFLNDGRLAELCRNIGVNTHVIDENMKSFPFILCEFIKIVRSYRPDVIHSHRRKENVLAALARPASKNCRLVSTLHGLSEGNSSLRSRILELVNVFFITLFFHKVVAVSRDVSNYLGKTPLLSKGKIHTIHNGIQLPERKSQSQRSDGLFAVGSAGRLFPIKDYLFMVSVADEVCRARPNTRFVLAGDGPEREKIKESIRACKLEERFVLLGNVVEMDRFYDSLDIYLNTSLHEGIPMTVLEAMAHARPVVAPAVGGLMEIITPGEDGYLVSGRSEKDFAQHIISLIDQPQNLSRVGENARDKIDRMFTASHMVDKYARLYRQVLSA